MAIEEKVVQSESVTPSDQSVTETPSTTNQTHLILLLLKAEYEAKLLLLKKESAEAKKNLKVQSLN